jgi:hypothetical protein
MHSTSPAGCSGCRAAGPRASAGPQPAPYLPPPLAPRHRAAARPRHTPPAATLSSDGGDGGNTNGGGGGGGSNWHGGSNNGGSGGGGSNWHGGSDGGDSGGRWLTSLLSFVNFVPTLGLLSLLLPGRGAAAGGKRGQASTQGRLLSLFVMASAAGSPALARLALWGF